MTRLIDAEALKEKAETVTLWNGEVRRFVSYETIDNAPTVPLPDFKDGYKQAIRDGKTNFSRPKGKWIKEDKPWGGFGDCILVNTCPFCKESFIYHGNDPKFCSECGADMREV